MTATQLRLAAAAATAAGVTRLGDITGLDWIGVPVFQAVRPKSLALSVHQGKALTAEGAMLGALMEAAESHHAESARRRGLWSAFADLDDAERAPCLADFSFDRSAAPPEDEPMLWTAGRRIIDGGRIWTPFDCISLDFSRTGDTRLDRGSDGQAARFDLEGAAGAALLEVIERDAVATWRSQSPISRSLTALALDTIPSPWFQRLGRRLSSRGLFITVFELEAVIPVPTYVCQLIEPGAASDLQSGRVFGSASNASASRALQGAVLEAVQSRLTYISGARDDVFPASAAAGATAGFGLPLPPGVPARSWRDRSRSDLDGAMQLAGALAAAGFPDSAIVQLSPPGAPVRVVKAVSPGLAGAGRTRRISAPSSTLRPRRSSPKPRLSNAPSRREPSDRIVVFAGPSLPPASRPADASIVWRPPAMAGDGLEWLDEPPAAVVLIDGLFDRHPAVRHKELLALLARGVAVFGAASMGALRAAELEPYGMVGVGRIFAAYRDGRLVDDAEVAVLHGPGEVDWAALTEPLVNVRATIQASMRGRVITPAGARALLAAAASLYYQERTWTAVLQEAERRDPPGEAGRMAFARWLPDGRVDLKRMDAITCMKAALAAAGGEQPRRRAPPLTMFTEALALARGLELWPGRPAGLDERAAGAAEEPRLRLDVAEGAVVGDPGHEGLY